jgi:predicted DNA-binding protein
MDDALSADRPGRAAATAVRHRRVPAGLRIVHAAALQGSACSTVGSVAAGLRAQLLRQPRARRREARYIHPIMSSSAKEILEAALKLDPVERARVAETLLHSLSEAEIEAIEDTEDIADAEAALEEMKRTGEQPIPWEEIKKQHRL